MRDKVEARAAQLARYDKEDDPDDADFLAEDEAVTCEWFATCTNEATESQYVPGRGAVPICSRCKRIVGL